MLPLRRSKPKSTCTGAHDVAICAKSAVHPQPHIASSTCASFPSRLIRSSWPLTVRFARNSTNVGELLPEPGVARVDKMWATAGVVHGHCCCTTVPHRLVSAHGDRRLTLMEPGRSCCKQLRAPRQIPRRRRERAERPPFDHPRPMDLPATDVQQRRPPRAKVAGPAGLFDCRPARSTLARNPQCSDASSARPSPARHQ